MSASVGAVVVANAKHLLQDRMYRRQRTQLPGLHLVEQAPQLLVPLHLVLQVASCPRRRDREHLAREIAGPPALELAFRLEPGAVLADLLPERVDALAA